MKAMLQRGYGDPDRVLSLGELPTPEPGEGEVLVRVRATSVNTPDWIGAQGVPYVLRLAVIGLAGPASPVRGSDVAGVVAAVGAGVGDFAPGDEVYGSVWTGGYAGPGSFAEYGVAPAGQLARKPAGTSFEEAAGAVMSGVTTLQALRDVAGVRPGMSVLINGASGGLGTFAIQIAKVLGAVVTAVCSTANVALVRSLGADEVTDYTREDYTKGERRYDVILDNVMNHPPAASAAVLNPGGVLIPNSIGANRWLGSLPEMAFAAIFRARQWPAVTYRPTRENLEALTALLESGRVRVVIDRAYPLEEAGAAVTYMASRRARGKVVLHVE